MRMWNGRVQLRTEELCLIQFRPWKLRSIYESFSVGSTWTCVCVCLSQCSGHLLGYFSFRDVSWGDSNTISCRMSLTTPSCDSASHFVLFLPIHVLFHISGSFYSPFLLLFPSLFLSLVFLALFHWPVSWLDNANTLFITLHSFSGFYGMPSNQAIVSYGARELIMRHRTSVNAVSYETWHALISVEAEHALHFHRLILLWSSLTCTKSPCCNIEFRLLGCFLLYLMFWEQPGLPAHSLTNSQARKYLI